MATFNDCKHAQQGLKDALWDLAEVDGVGITAKDGDYFFRILLEKDSTVVLPTEWQGIPVVYHAIGL